MHKFKCPKFATLPPSPSVPSVSLRFRSRALHLAGCLLVALAACGGEQKPEAAASAKAPAQASEIPAGIQIEVEIDGEPASPIDSALLRRVEPDFRTGARRSWKIERLVGPAAARPKNVLEVENAEGVTTAFPPGATRMWEPVLSLNRRGDLLVALRAREDPPETPLRTGLGSRRTRRC